MLKYLDQRVSKIALAVIISGISLAQPAYARDHAVDPTVRSSEKHHDMMDRVEHRIRTMHDKLNLTDDQESQWKDVADVMRSNEKVIHKLVQDRHENEPDTAVEDLKSYETIADAHTEGLKKLIPAFETLYDSLSDEQKAKADDMFGGFEGRAGHKAE